jgi:hypothetical protein
MRFAEDVTVMRGKVNALKFYFVNLMRPRFKWQDNVIKMDLK